MPVRRRWDTAEESRTTLTSWSGPPWQWRQSAVALGTLTEVHKHMFTHTLQHYFEGTQWLTHWSTQTHVHTHTAASFWRYPVANTLKYTNTCSHKHTEVHKHMFTQTLQHHSEGTQWLTHWSTQTHIYMLTHWSTQTHANTLKYTNTHSHAHCSIILKVPSG